MQIHLTSYQLSKLKNLLISNEEANIKLAFLLGKQCTLDSLQPIAKYFSKFPELCFNHLPAIYQSKKLLFDELPPLPITGNSFQHLTHLTVLSLPERGLKKIPDSVQHLKQLRRLNLSGNELSELPKWLFSLTNLEYLDLSENKIKEIPQEISNLHQLKILYLHRNTDLTSLPFSIGSLTKLKILKVNECPVQILPTSITNLHHLKVLEIS